MGSVIAASKTPFMETGFAPHKLTLEQYAAMIETGILTTDDRVELISGVVVDVSPQGVAHAVICRRLMRMLFSALPEERASVSASASLELPPDSMPEPDLAVHAPGIEGRGDATNTLLVIEVSDSSVRYDRDAKMPLYARAGIPEAWLVDVQAEAVEVYRGPLRGRYSEMKTVRTGELLAPLAFPDVLFPVEGMF